MLLYWAFRLAASLCRAAPLSAAYAAGAAAGLGAYYAWPGGRRRCIANMRRLVGGDEAAARTAARRSFANYGRYLIDFFRFTSVTAEEVRARIRFDRWDHVDAERRGNGTVFITMHFGNWDMGAAALAERGVPVSVIADTFANTKLNDLVLGARRHLGMEIIPAERMGPSILRALRRNEVVAMLIDVPPQDGRGIAVEFFGGTVALPDGPARIALRAGAQVVAAILPRLGKDAVGIEIAPVRFTPTGDADHDVRALTQATMYELESLIRSRPEQWYIFRALWLADRRRSEHTGPAASTA